MATRKKILFVVTKSNWGGAQRYVYDLATSLNQRYDCVVAAGGRGILLERLRKASVRTEHVASLERDVNAAADARALAELYRLFRRERPDIVHLNSSKAGALGALAARLAGIRRIVFTVHGWPFDEPIPPLARALRYLVSTVTLILCHRLITVSRFEDVHAPLFLPTIVIHNGIPDPAFLERDAARKRFGIAPEEARLVIGVVAELHRNKGIDLLIAAMPQVKDAILVIVGEGEERKTLERQAAAEGLGDRVRFTGFVPDAVTLMRAFDIFALPSRTEALGYVLLEAGIAGIAVVASTVGGIPEVIDDQLSGVLVPAYDVGALAEALNDLVESPNTRRRYGERLQEKIARYFPLDGMVKKTVAVYES